MAERLDVIVAGVGGNSRRWFKAMQDSGRWRAAAAVDPDPAARKRAATEFGVEQSRLFESLRDALKRVAEAPVLVLTPSNSHRRPVEEALEAGRHVLSEKPMATEIADGRHMVALAQTAGRIYMVNQNYRYCGFARSFRAALDGGEIGEPSFAEAYFHRLWPPSGYRASMPDVIVFEMCIHHLDLMRYWFGSDVAVVYARYPRAPWSGYAGAPMVQALLRMESGVSVAYSASRQSRGLQTPYEGVWRVVGSKGSLHLADLGAGFGVYVDTGAGPARLVRSSEGMEPGFAAVLNEFADCIQTGREPETSGRDNIATLAAACAITESARTGKELAPSTLL